MKALYLQFISFYQRFLAPDKGLLRVLGANQCLFTPSCSHYSRQAVEKYGVVKGVWRTLKRLLRCHPWGKGGMDLP
ncbi:MAG: membrane protein insertion efficiency factor YidD [bacterium]|nr:membrane protein insertion efficiency factor YidD [bacterium]